MEKGKKSIWPYLLVLPALLVVICVVFILSLIHILPAIFSSFLICLTYSIDDFIISYFTSGTVQTLPIAIYSMTKKRVSPEINALSAIMFVVILAIILISNAADSAKEKRLERAVRAEERKAGMA